MQRWEYRTRIFGVAFGSNWLHEQLAELGEQGWELVVALPVGGGVSVDHHTYVFKRPKVDPALTVAPPRIEGETPPVIGSPVHVGRAA